MRVGDLHDLFAEVAEERARVDRSAGDGTAVGYGSQDHGALVVVEVCLTGAGFPYSVDCVVSW